MIFDKVKAAFIAVGFVAAIAALTAVGEFAADFDWSFAGPFAAGISGLVGAGITALVAFLKREQTGYGNGVPTIPDPDEIPGGTPVDEV